MKKNFGLHKIGFVLFGLASVFQAVTPEVLSQVKQEGVQQASSDNGDDTWWYLMLFVLISILVGAVIRLLKNKKAATETAQKTQNARKGDNSWEAGSLDADREMEWLRKNQKLVDKKRKRNVAKRKPQDPSFSSEIIVGKVKKETTEYIDGDLLPVFGFNEIEPAKSFSQLPISNDDSLINAIEQVHDEYEEDEEVRDLAVRILMAFKTRNSIEALSQAALYDLSSALRSKAVLTLTEFDHESVFETILLACADPTREVRAAAARGLTRLSFDRADAWARIAETGEKGRMRQAARAAIESGFVERSFDRLVHSDRQHAYEAFVLLSLLVKAGETEPLFEAIKTHRDKLVQLAILHLFKVTQDQESLNELIKLLEDKKLPADLRAEINKTVEAFGMAAV